LEKGRKNALLFSRNIVQYKMTVKCHGVAIYRKNGEAWQINKMKKK